jgi:membrane protein implicated in regulation of membrane protease activity
MFTATFYGLSLAFSSLIVSLYVYIQGDTLHSLPHALLFVVMSALMSYFLPKFLQSKNPDVPQGVEKYIGEKRSVKKLAGDYKIALDGVDYMIESDDDIEVSDRVEVIGHK